MLNPILKEIVIELYTRRYTKKKYFIYSQPRDPLDEEGGEEKGRGSLSANPLELGRLFTIEQRTEKGRRQCTHRHVLAPVSREGLFILEEDAVTRLPARLARCLADAALGLWKENKKEKSVKRGGQRASIVEYIRSATIRIMATPSIIRRERGGSPPAANHR